MKPYYRTLIYWIGRKDDEPPDTLFPTPFIRLRDLQPVSANGPAIVFLDCRMIDGYGGMTKIWSMLGPSHVIVAVVDALVDHLTSLLHDGADDVVEMDMLVRPALVLARAVAQLHLRRCAEDDYARAKLLQACLDNLPAPIFFKNASGVYMGCNRAFERFIGFTRNRILGHTVYDVAPPELAHIYHNADLDLMASGGTQTYEANVRYADGTTHDVSFHKAAFFDTDGQVMGLAGAMLDITDRKKLEVELRLLAEQDPLTGLPNRRKFFEVAERIRQGVQKTSESQLWVLVIDVDHFKLINDSFGHSAGDVVLQHVAASLQRAICSDDIVARVGGEEFFAILRDVSRPQCLLIAKRMQAEVERVFAGERSPRLPIVTVSIGAGQWHSFDEGIDTALKRADAQMYRAKTSGRNQIMLPETSCER